MKICCFDAEKLVEVLLYIAGRCPDIHSMLAILSRADKSHLHKYGRTVCGMSYDEMKFGPGPRDAIALIRHARGDSACCPDVDISKAFRADFRTIYPERSADLNYLSESDIEILESEILIQMEKDKAA